MLTEAVDTLWGARSAAAVAWVFYARTSWGAWLGLLAPAAVMGAMAMAPRWLGAAA